jgi:hypothetical protein
MTDQEDPPRLLDASAGAPAGLRDLLDAARNDVGSDAQVARLAQRLGPLLPPPAIPAPATAATASGMGGALKLGLAGVALLVVGGGAWLLLAPKSAAPSTPISAPRVLEQPPSAPAAPLPAAAPAVPLVVTPQPDDASAQPPGAAKLPAKPAVAQVSEAELLEQARTALKSAPARALARANEHRARFPGGVLVQEREVIAIQALRQLGRSAEADQRAEAFAKAFPGSAFARKLKSSP